MEQLQLTRVTQEEQINQVASLGHTIWNECFAKILSQGQIDYMLNRFQSAPAVTGQIRESGYEYYLLGTGGRPFGYTGIIPQPQEGRLMLSKVYMLSSERGKGYVTDVFDFVEKRARELACPLVWLTVNRYNARAIAAYKRRGFVLLREQQTDIGNGYCMDDFVFEKHL